MEEKVNSGSRRTTSSTEVMIYEFSSGCSPFFCSREDNHFAAQILSSVDFYNPIILYGPSGIGKSHAARGFLTDFSSATNKTLKLITATDLINQIIADPDHPETIVNNFSHVDILIVDDAFVLYGKTYTQHTLFNIFWEMVNNGKIVVIIVDELNGLDDAFLKAFTKFDKGVFVDMNYPTMEAKTAYAEYRANQLGLHFGSDEIQNVVANAKTISQINGNLLAIQAQSKL